MNTVKAILFSIMGLSLVAGMYAGEPAYTKQREEKRNQEEMDAQKSQIASSLLKAIAIGIAGKAVSTIPALKNTGIDVGIQVGAGLMSLSLFLENQKNALQSMAISAPVVSGMGALLSKNSVTGKNGIFAKYLPFGLGAVVQSVATSESFEKHSALLALATVGCYIAIKSPLDRFSMYLQKKGSDAYNFVAAALS